MRKQTDGQTDRQTDRQVDKQKAKTSTAALPPPNTHSPTYPLPGHIPTHLDNDLVILHSQRQQLPRSLLVVKEGMEVGKQDCHLWGEMKGGEGEGEGKGRENEQTYSLDSNHMT